MSTDTKAPATTTETDGHGREWTNRLTDTFGGSFTTQCRHCGNERRCAARWEESTHTIGIKTGGWIFLCDPCNPAPTGSVRTYFGL